MKHIRQFAVDIIDSDYSITEEEIAEALEDAGFIVIGCAWKATWTEDGYEHGEPPISSD